MGGHKILSLWRLMFKDPKTCKNNSKSPFPIETVCSQAFLAKKRLETAQFFGHRKGAFFYPFFLSFWFRVVFLIKITEGVSAVFLCRIF
jgi:hypothetical protein